jgi:secondary thiamine-phosphate synthase enzyme
VADRLKFKTKAREQLLDITKEVSELIKTSQVKDGVAFLWSMHTTCALTVNEGADPSVRTDMTRFMSKLIPQDAGFDHEEGNSDSHIKTSLFGPGLTLLVENGEPLLGTWQSIYLAEWDGPRSRTIAVTILPTD